MEDVAGTLIRGCPSFSVAFIMKQGKELHATDITQGLGKKAEMLLEILHQHQRKHVEDNYLRTRQMLQHYHKPEEESYEMLWAPTHIRTTKKGHCLTNVQSDVQWENEAENDGFHPVEDLLFLPNQSSSIAISTSYRLDEFGSKNPDCSQL
ncbi:uncharacterized protein J5F26_009577 [Ciconia maguari]